MASLRSDVSGVDGQLDRLMASWAGVRLGGGANPGTGQLSGSSSADQATLQLIQQLLANAPEPGAKRARGKRGPDKGQSRKRRRCAVPNCPDAANCRGRNNDHRNCPNHDPATCPRCRR
jgi:hypothetical protein